MDFTDTSVVNDLKRGIKQITEWLNKESEIIARIDEKHGMEIEQFQKDKARALDLLAEYEAVMEALGVEYDPSEDDSDPTVTVEEIQVPEEPHNH